MTEISTMLLLVINENNVQKKNSILDEAEKILNFIYKNCPGLLIINKKKNNNF